MTIGTLVFNKSSYKSVLCLGHILDKDGRKMSKHLGNVLEPIALMDQHGADAVRWYMLAAGSPWAARRVGHDAINEVVRKTLLTYWNTVSFHALYANASQFDLSQRTKVADRPLMDRWIISELNLLIEEVDAALTDFDSQVAGRALARFIDDLSNWYVRRSRRRFWDGDASALSTLHECLVTLTQLLSPMVPFITEQVWQELVIPADSSAVASVHLSDFPVADSAVINRELGNQVALTRRIVELGRASRAESGIKIRQPLGRALIAASGWAALPEQMREQIADELNVIDLQDIAHADGDLVDISIKANFKSLGAKYGGAVQEIAKAIAATDATALVKTLRASGTTQLGSWEITLDDLVITEVPKTGWMVALETPRIATSGALTIGVKPVPPMWPRLEMVKQAPCMSSAVSFLSRALAASAAASAASCSRLFWSTFLMTGTSRPSGVSTAKPMFTYFLRMIALPLGASELLKSGSSLSRCAQDLSSSGRMVSLTPAFSATAFCAVRNASSSVISAESNCVTCGTFSQLRCRLAAPTCIRRVIGTSSTAPNLLKSTSGIGGIPLPAVTPAAGAALAFCSCCLTNSCTSSLRMRPCGPLALTAFSSTPNSRAS